MVAKTDVERVGLVGDEGLAGAVRDADATPVAGDAEAVLEADPDAVVAVGEAALLACARLRPDQPLVAVDAGPGAASVARSALGTTLAALRSGECQPVAHPVLAVAVDGDRVGRALLDATLVADESARISAFDLAADGESLAAVRADGVVVATPAGTAGYASRLGAPAVAPGTGALAVEPIAQFATVPDRWVVRDAGVTATVARDDVPVAVVADDRQVATVDVGDAVSVTRDGSVSLVAGPESAAVPDR